MGSDAAAMAALGKSVIPAHMGISNGFVNTSLRFQAVLDKFSFGFGSNNSQEGIN
jgi:hypothetical protein